MYLVFCFSKDIVGFMNLIVVFLDILVFWKLRIAPGVELILLVYLIRNPLSKKDCLRDMPRKLPTLTTNQIG